MVALLLLALVPSPDQSSQLLALRLLEAHFQCFLLLDEKRGATGIALGLMGRVGLSWDGCIHLFDVSIVEELDKGSLVVLEGLEAVELEAGGEVVDWGAEGTVRIKQ